MWTCWTSGLRLGVDVEMCLMVVHYRILSLLLSCFFLFVSLFHFADMLKSLISNWIFCPLVLFFLFLVSGLSFFVVFFFGVASPSVGNTRLWSEAVHSVEVCSSSRAVFSLLILPLLLEHKVDVFSFGFLAPFFFLLLLLLTVGLRWARRVLPRRSLEASPFSCTGSAQMPFLFFCSFLFL